MMIRHEQPSDAAAIRTLLEAAFSQATEAQLVDQLRADGDAVIAGVAVGPQGIAGHIMFSKLAAPFRALALAPIAVAPERQRQGIGGLLIRWGVRESEKAGWRAIFVLGEPHYYRRFGFDPELARAFTSSYDGPHFMMMPLGGGSPPGAGRVDHARAFGLLR